MSMTRVIILLIAIGAGGIAFFLVASGDDAPQQAIAQAIPKAAEGPKMTRVLVTADDISQGSVLSEESTSWVRWPADQVPEFYVTEDEKAFIEALPQMRALRSIRAGEPLTSANTVRHGDRGLLAAIMTPGMRAVTARLSAEQTSGGFILPGDRVDVYASGIDPSSDARGPTSWVLFSNVRVLAIDQAYSTSDETTALVGRTVTLELAPDQVSRFIEARDTQGLTLVLRSVFDADIEETQQTTVDQVVVIRYGQG